MDKVTKKLYEKHGIRLPREKELPKRDYDVVEEAIKTYEENQDEFIP